MPRLPKFKDFHISPLTGPMNSRTPLDLLPQKQFRHVKNFRVDGAGRLRRGAGFKPLFDDGNYGLCYIDDSINSSYTTKATCEANSGTWSIKNNTDLHDQLGSKEDPTNSINEPITMLYEFESGGGSRKLVAASKSRIYALSQRTRNWTIIGDNGGSGYGEGISTDYTTTKFKAAQLGNNIVFTNNYNEPLYWFFDTKPDRADKNLVQTIPDLVKLKITKAQEIVEYKGFLFLGNLEENYAQQIAKVQWSDFVDATSYYPSLASLSGQQTVGDIGEAIIGMAVLGDHLMIYKERSIWRCSLVSSANLFVFKQVYQGENTPYYEDTLVTVGDAHFFMAEAGIYRLTISDVRPILIDWMHNASGIIFNKGEIITREDDSAGVCIISGATNPDYKTKATCEAASGTWSPIQGGIKDNKVVQEGTIAALAPCPARAPTIDTHPVNVSNINTNPCDASSYTKTITFTVEAEGREPFSYQWKKKNSSQTAAQAVSISGATKKTFVITNPESSDVKDFANADDFQYGVVVTNEDGTVTSNFATTTLASGSYSNSPDFTLQPEDVTEVIGGDAVLEARWCTASAEINQAGGASGTQWLKSTDDGDTYAAVALNAVAHVVESGLQPPDGSTAGYYHSKLTVKNLTFVEPPGDALKYKINVVNPAGNTDSDVATITVIKAATDDAPGGNLTLFAQHNYYRDVRVDETVGFEIKREGGVIVQSAPGLANNNVVRDGNTKAYYIRHEPLTIYVVGGTPPYTFAWYKNIDLSGAELTAARTQGSGVAVSVKAMGWKMAIGDIMKWYVSPNMAVLTLTAAVDVGDTTLTGDLTGADLPAPTGSPAQGLQSYMYWNPVHEHRISPFSDSTCDTTSFNVASCITTVDSKIVTCPNQVSIPITESQYVIGTGLVDETYIVSVDVDTDANGEAEPGTTALELSKAAEAAGSVTLSFTKTTVTCDSSSFIKVGQPVSGEVIEDNDVTVVAVTVAGAVTSFELSAPTTPYYDNDVDAWVIFKNNIELTFTPVRGRDYLIKTSSTKFDNDTSKMSYKWGDKDTADKTNTVGIGSVYRCLITDSAGASGLSGIFYTNYRTWSS